MAGAWSSRLELVPEEAAAHATIDGVADPTAQARDAVADHVVPSGILGRVWQVPGLARSRRVECRGALGRCEGRLLWVGVGAGDGAVRRGPREREAAVVVVGVRARPRVGAGAGAGAGVRVVLGRHLLATGLAERPAGGYRERRQRHEGAGGPVRAYVPPWCPCAAVAAADDAAALRAAGQQGLTERAERRPN